mmetsp:Transcript_39875/g.38429  ORF Transcript_39875/g.38429 Transcript_39875/m.38429 type:complete len:95 (-) Transcript_39875:744-1028(-)
MPVIFLGFVDNGPNIVSVDSNGHIFIWKQDKALLSTKKQFNPYIRFRLELSYVKFNRLQEKVLFPSGSLKIDPKKGNALSNNLAQSISAYMQQN